MALTEAVKEAIWLRGLIGDLGVAQEAVVVFYDSQSTIHLVKNHALYARTKHIDIRYHFCRDAIDDGVVIAEKVDTKENPADMLTKVVPGIKFEHCLDLIKLSH